MKVSTFWARFHLMKETFEGSSFSSTAEQSVWTNITLEYAEFMIRHI